MWIRRIEVRHCAGIAAGAVDLQRDFNVLHGPSELGKSTLVSALRAAFLLSATSSLAGALQDWNAQEPPEVSVTFEDDDGRVWRIRKTFSGGGGKAFLDASRDGEHFDTDARGREVDGRLQEILRWGIEAPGGRGRRGMPSSLITTALLPDQSEVEAILGRSLADDADDSGRDRLTEALHALAEDPRFKQMVDVVQARVDEAFTPTGQKRRGKGSPWRGLADDRRRADEWEREVRRQSNETAGVVGLRGGVVGTSRDVLAYALGVVAGHAGEGPHGATAEGDVLHAPTGSHPLQCSQWRQQRGHGSAPDHHAQPLPPEVFPASRPLADLAVPRAWLGGRSGTSGAGVPGSGLP